MSDSKIVLVSACLLGQKTRYDGRDAADFSLIKFVKSKKIIPIPVCPEQLGGLPTPREPCWFVGGDGSDVLRNRASVIGVNSKKDFTKNFLQGARLTLELAKFLNIREAYLKENSPSCGVRFVWINGEKIKGQGVTTALLKNHGIKVKPFG